MESKWRLLYYYYYYYYYYYICRILLGLYVGASGVRARGSEFHSLTAFYGQRGHIGLAELGEPMATLPGSSLVAALRMQKLPGCLASGLSHR